MHPERASGLTAESLPLAYDSLRLPKFSKEETAARRLDISKNALLLDPELAARVEGLKGLSGSVALRAIDDIAADFTVRTVSARAGVISDGLIEKAGRAVQFKEWGGVPSHSGELFALQEMVVRTNRVKRELVRDWILSARETGLDEVETIEYLALIPAMNANDLKYLKLVTEVPPINSDERVKGGMTNEGAIVRKHGALIEEVPMHVAYPKETQAILDAYGVLLTELRHLASEAEETDSAALNRIYRKVLYYEAVVNAYATSDPQEWLKADTFFAGQIPDGTSAIHIHDFEVAYLEDKVIRAPEISLRAPDLAAARTQELSMATKARMLRMMDDPSFAHISTMERSRILVSKSNAAARHFFGSGLETLDLKPAGQILPNELASRVEGGIDTSLDLETTKERQSLINRAFSAVFGEETFKDFYEPGIDFERELGESVASHEFGHAIGLRPETDDRLGRSFRSAYIEEWKATVGGIIFNTWLPYQKGEVSFDELKNEIRYHVGRLIRNIANRGRPAIQPYAREAMLLAKVAEDTGVVKRSEGNEMPWGINLTEENVHAFYGALSEQYKKVLNMYAAGNAADLKAFLGDSLQSTPFIEYATSAVDSLSPSQTLITPSKLATTPA